MRRIGFILMFMLYTFSSVGVSVTLHFCGGSFEHFSWGKHDSGPCSCGVGQMKKSCCKDVYLDWRISSKQVPSDEIIPTFASTDFIPQIVYSQEFQGFNLKSSSDLWSIETRPPPRWGGLQIFKAIRSFRI